MIITQVNYGIMLIYYHHDLINLLADNFPPDDNCFKTFLGNDPGSVNSLRKQNEQTYSHVVYLLTTQPGIFTTSSIHPCSFNISGRRRAILKLRSKRSKISTQLGTCLLSHKKRSKR